MSNIAKPILVIEDDTTLNRLLVAQLKKMGFDAKGVANMVDARQAVHADEPALALLDFRLPDTTGFEFISWLHERCPVIILTAYGSIDQAVQAVQAGASEYLVKPISQGRLEIALNRALETANMRRTIEFLETKVKGKAEPKMIGQSDAFKRIAQMIGMVAKADTTVLIGGESGVGKELVAESIHSQSPRSNHQLVTIDCATLHENLLESELFGHERGSFTGADRKKPGLIEVDDGGTVFLDEIGEITPPIQAKLLRVLETSRFRRLGGTQDLTANVRFIAATNRDLRDLVKEGKFRGDLYYRLSAFTIVVPPLRERREDILPIARRFLAQRQFMRNINKVFDTHTERALTNYSWPGNIRELRNVVERSLLMSGDAETILPKHLVLPVDHDAFGGNGSGMRFEFDHEPTLEELKSTYVEKMLRLYQGSKTKAARAMGISERNLYRLIDKKQEQGDDI